MPYKYNIIITRGDTWAKSFQFVRNGLPIDITGWVIRFTAKRNITDSDVDAIIKKDITTHINPTQGETQVSLSVSDTDQDVGVPFHYDIEFTTPLGEKRTTLKGLLQFLEDVTQRTS